MRGAFSDGPAARLIPLTAAVPGLAMIVAMAIILRRTYGGDAAIYLLEGGLVVYTPDHEGQGVFELKPNDGCFVPEGTPYRCSNWSDRPTRLIIGVAPDYLARDQ